MKIREGMIPTILGTVVTAAGLSLNRFLQNFMGYNRFWPRSHTPRGN